MKDDQMDDEGPQPNDRRPPNPLERVRQLRAGVAGGKQVRHARRTADLDGREGIQWQFENDDSFRLLWEVYESANRRALRAEALSVTTERVYRPGGKAAHLSLSTASESIVVLCQRQKYMPHGTVWRGLDDDAQRVRADELPTCRQCDDVLTKMLDGKMEVPT